jgi:hypothetical protein
MHGYYAGCCPSARRTARLTVLEWTSEIGRDRLQRVGPGDMRRSHGRPLVAICLDKRLQRLWALARFW